MTRFITYILVIILTTSCIELYDFDVKVEFKSFPVIEGTIIDQPEDGYYQNIRISFSSNLDTRKYEGYPYADVIVHNLNGNYYVFEYNQNTDSYQGHIPPDDLVPGAKFQLEVNLEGETYRSETETMHACPELDSIYYKLENIEGAELGSETVGANFFVNFRANNSFGSFYRIIIEETYEYRSQWPIQNYYDRYNKYHSVLDWSKYYCWSTEDLPNIYTLSTDGFTQNEYIKYPLHFVSNSSQRLLYNYSINLKLYSLSEDSFNFWHSLRNNNQESFDMFGKQPAKANSNIYNETNPEAIVLGYFGVSALSEKRFTINGGIKTILYDYYRCTPIPLELGIPWTPRPLYLVRIVHDGKELWGTENSSCWVCTEHGGTTIKPDFFN